MRVKLWGVRGSLPSPHSPEQLDARLRSVLQEFFKRGHTSPAQIDAFLASLPLQKRGGFGGNTACIEVFSDTTSLIIDAGSGLRRIGEKMMGGACGLGRGEAHILFTHFHWDHLIGLPFFIPIFVPGNQIHLYAVQPELEDVVRMMFTKPYFPVPFEQLGAKIHFHRLEPRQAVQHGDLRYTPYQLDHPDPCWGYKFESAGTVFSYCVDTEAKRLQPAELGPDLPLYQGVDLMVFDAQYTLLEVTEKINWGHAAAPIGLDLAMREGIKRVLFMHHDPAASDDKIADAERQTREYFQAYQESARAAGRPAPVVEWSFAQEGMVVTV
ncbi:MAG: MBL fold metallo-hydrolase [Bdellovibrionaceae bacterium]|nr:MBL fold metallo-hydrolase [Pseudobdellovibrionaceae bacterium]